VRLPILSFALAALAAAIHTLPGASEALQFDRTAIANGEHWRWLTAHFAHFGANHLTWDVAALLALGWLCEGVSRLRTALALAFAAGTITPAVWLWQPEFATYRGLSGLDCALFGLFAATLGRRSERAAKLAGILALVACGAKCVAELASGATVFAAGTGYAPVPLAHTLGLACGTFMAGVRLGQLRRRLSKLAEGSDTAVCFRSPTPRSSSGSRSAVGRG
jgi:rhomboid family GlyGly-CTERM serine protease